MFAIAVWLVIECSGCSRGDKIAELASHLFRSMAAY